MKIVIVGAGAIGMVFGAYFCRAGHQVVFIEKQKNTVDAINEQGIGFMEPEATARQDQVFIPAVAVADSSEIKECDLVLLAVKSFDTYTATASISHLVNFNSPIISLQTGLGHMQIIEKILQRPNLLGGLTYMAGAALGPGRVRLGGIGKTFLGELDGHISDRTNKVAALLNESGLKTEVVENIVERMWGKALVYSVINPVTALFKIKNGQLLEKMDALTLAKRLVDEGCMVAKANNIILDKDDLFEMFFNTCRNTSANISSMLLDRLNERKAEIDTLNGEIVRIGKKYGVPATTHETLVNLIKLCDKWPGKNEESL